MSDTLRTSLYLMHSSMIWALEKHMPWSRSTRGVVTLAVLFLFASLIYGFVEKPSARLRRNLARYLDKHKAPSNNTPSPNPVVA